MVQQLMIAGEAVTIRPIRPDDVGMESEFISRLSPQTRHFRFFGALRELPAAELVRLCSVDGRYSMAYVATVRRLDRELEIGVSRYAANDQSGVREIAVTVADEWQRKGLGAALTRTLIEQARSIGVKRLYSIELADNVAMQRLAKDLGMSAARDPNDPQQVVHSLAL